MAGHGLSGLEVGGGSLPPVQCISGGKKKEEEGLSVGLTLPLPCIGPSPRSLTSGRQDRGPKAKAVQWGGSVATLKFKG